MSAFWGFFFIGMVFIVMGFLRIWNKETNIKKPREHEGKRGYVTFGELWTQKIKLHFKGGKK